MPTPTPTPRPHRRVALVLVLVLGLVGIAACADSPGAATGDGTGPTAGDPPSPGGDPAGQGAAAPGGALTVEEALASDLAGPLTVQGFLIEADGTTRLCAVSLESLPPQCGEPSLQVEGVAAGEVAGAQTAQGVTWVDQVTLTGVVQDGVLQVEGTTS